MSITLKIHPDANHFIKGPSAAEVQGATVGECLNDLVRQFPDIKTRLFDAKGTLLNYIDVYVNRASSYPLELATPVHDGDELSIIVMIVGG